MLPSFLSLDKNIKSMDIRPIPAATVQPFHISLWRVFGEFLDMAKRSSSSSSLDHRSFVFGGPSLDCFAVFRSVRLSLFAIMYCHRGSETPSPLGDVPLAREGCVPGGAPQKVLKASRVGRGERTIVNVVECVIAA